MKTVLYWYSGTGNSLWAARTLARELGEAELLPIKRATVGGVRPGADGAIGLVFPVHMWGVPRPVLEFVSALARPPAAAPAAYWFAVTVNAGQTARSQLQLRRHLARRGLELAAGFAVALPSNYAPWGGPGPVEEQERQFSAARARLSEVAAAVRDRRAAGLETGPLFSSLAFSALNRLVAPLVPRLDRSFLADSRCDGCGVCARVCPAGNIELEAGRPRWLHRCEQCYACLQWCPREAIQYGRKTPQVPRYHHPEVSLKDILAGGAGAR